MKKFLTILAAVMLACGLSALAAGLAIGIAGDAGVRALSDHDGDSGGNEVGSEFFEGSVEFLGSLSQYQWERKEKG